MKRLPVHRPMRVRPLPRARYATRIALDIAFVMAIVFSLATSSSFVGATSTAGVRLATEYGSGSTLPAGVSSQTVGRGVSPAVSIATGSQAGPLGSTNGSMGPTTFRGTAMAYDPIAGYTVAYDEEGYNLTTRNGSWAPSPITWKFANDSWSILNATGVPPRFLSSRMVFDAADQCLVLFGGELVGNGSAGYPSVNYTWTFAKGVWSNQTNLSRPTPPALGLPGAWQMTYDVSDGYVLLFADTVWGGGGAVETWSYRAGGWTNLSGSRALAPPVDGALGYDSTLGSVVYVGGASGNLSVLWEQYAVNTTWTFHAGAWTNQTSNVSGAPPAQFPGSVIDDPTMGGLLLFGADAANPPSYPTFVNDTWLLRNTTWVILNQTVAPSPRVGSAMTYDAGRGEVDLYGGFGETPVLDPNGSIQYIDINDLLDTWTFTNGTWVPRAPVLALSAPEMDAGGTLTVSVPGGSLLGTTVTFTYAGLPPGCVSVNAATFTCHPTGTGTYAPLVEVSAGGLGIARARLVVNPQPTVTSFQANLSETDIGLGFSLAAVAVGGTGGLVYSYSGLPTGCTGRDSPMVTCIPATAGLLQIGVDVADELGVHAGANLTVLVNPRPTVSDLRTLPANITAGEPFTVEVTFSGGTGEPTVALSGLPVSCGPMNRTAFECPAVPLGIYTLNASATDGLGISAQVSVRLVVAAPVGPPNESSSSWTGGVGSTMGIAAGVGLLGVVAVVGWVIAERSRRRAGEQLVRRLEEETDRKAGSR